MITFKQAIDEVIGRGKDSERIFKQAHATTKKKLTRHGPNKNVDDIHEDLRKKTKFVFNHGDGSMHTFNEHDHETAHMIMRSPENITAGFIRPAAVGDGIELHVSDEETTSILHANHIGSHEFANHPAIKRLNATVVHEDE